MHCWLHDTHTISATKSVFKNDCVQLNFMHSKTWLKKDSQIRTFIDWARAMPGLFGWAVGSLRPVGTEPSADEAKESPVPLFCLSVPGTPPCHCQNNRLPLNSIQHRSMPTITACAIRWSNLRLFLFMWPPLSHFHSESRGDNVVPQHENN